MILSNAVPVTVNWTQEKRERLPTSGEYTTLARCIGDDTANNGQQWSIKLTFSPMIQSADAPEWKGFASFLVDDAPWERLQPGAVFETFEGRRATARVTVLRQAERP
jgi:hypothetical protein